jgi:hypothetical protein
LLKTPALPSPEAQNKEVPVLISLYCPPYEKERIHL